MAIPPQAASRVEQVWTASIRARVATVALWIWLAAYFVTTVNAGSAVVETRSRVFEVLLLAGLVAIRMAGPVDRRQAYRVLGSFGLLLLVSAVYSITGAAPPVGTWTSYLHAAVLFSLTYGLTAAFAALFYDPAELVTAFWKIGRYAMYLGIMAYFVTVITGVRVLTNVRQDGVVRLQGLLSEPSAWAAVLAGLALLALYFRSYWTLAAISVAILISRSPTVFMVVAISLPLHWVLTRTWNTTKVPVLVAVAMVSIIAVNFVLTANPNDYLKNPNTIVQSAGRLLRGVEEVRSGREDGTNTRYVNARQTFKDAERFGRLDTGYGPDAHAVYFPLEYPDRRGVPGVRPNSLWAVAGFNFGQYGAALIVAATAVAAFRMRREPLVAAVLLPFLVASMVNSAQGPELFKFVALSIVLFCFRWSRSSRIDAQPALGGSGRNRLPRGRSLPAARGAMSTTK